MAHYSIIHPGGWLSGYVVTTADLQTIDTELAACIHEGGGTWAPTSQIIIGGSGMQVTGGFLIAGAVATVIGGPDLNVTCTAEFTNTVTFVGNDVHDGTSEYANGATLLGDVGSVLTWHGTAVFDGSTQLKGTVSVPSGGPLFTISGQFVVGPTATMSVACAPTFSGLVTLSGGVSGATAFAGAVNMNAGGSVNSSTLAISNGVVQVGGGSVQTFASDGHIRWRRVTGVDATHTYSIADADFIFIPVSGLSGPQQYTMSNSGCVGGEVITVTNQDAATHAITLKQANGTTTIAVLNGSTSTKATIMNNGSGLANAGWDLVSLSG